MTSRDIKFSLETKRLYRIKLLEHFKDFVELAMDTDFNCYTPDLSRCLKKFKTNREDSSWYVDVGGHKVFQSYLTPLIA